MPQVKVLTCLRYVGEEVARLETLLAKGGISAEAKALFMTRRDILVSFLPKSGHSGDEL